MEDPKADVGDKRGEPELDAVRQEKIEGPQVQWQPHLESGANSSLDG